MAYIKNTGDIPPRPIGKGHDHTWRDSRGYASRHSRANRRKARRKK